MRQWKNMAKQSRQEMQETMQREVESLRLFQEELKTQVELLKVAFAERSRRGGDSGDTGATKKEQ